MIGKILFILFIALTIAAGIFVYSHFNVHINISPRNDGSSYQGPVPEGYDEPHFRLTGETIPILKD